MMYYTAKMKAKPKWLTKEDKKNILSFYSQAKLKNMHVDHIIPLKGKTVCGLHVPWNLQLLKPEDNLRKRNKLNV